jgi:L-seryl-tRNA(Ser) seleniumtransferase
MGNSQPPLSSLPAVGKLLARDDVRRWLAAHGEAVVADALRVAVDRHREMIQAGEWNGSALDDSVMQMAEEIIARQSRPALRRVINATGIVVHTGLGRAPLSDAAIEAIRDGASGYCNLELDLDSGERGRRIDHVRDLLCKLTGAEAATVVNNNAAATLLVLHAVADFYDTPAEADKQVKRYRKRNVIVSRGQLIEIGGSFRLPEIMKASGVQLKEVGTTNRTRLADYEQAIDERTAALMRVHTSNYCVAGFAEEVAIGELVKLGLKHNLPVIDDLGSGALVDLQPAGLAGEPAVSASLDAGADLVCFSGDKLLGGPQAGIVVGRADLVAKLKRNPMKRALRVDKMTIAALAAVLRLYADPDRLAARLPTIGLLGRPVAEIDALARRVAPVLAARLERRAGVEIAACQSQIGSGALPLAGLASVALTIRPTPGPGGGRRGTALRRLAAEFRALPVPVIGRIQDDALHLDLRCLVDEAGFVAQLARLGAE